MFIGAEIFKMLVSATRWEVQTSIGFSEGDIEDIGDKVAIELDLVFVCGSCPCSDHSGL